LEHVHSRFLLSFTTELGVALDSGMDRHHTGILIGVVDLKKQGLWRIPSRDGGKASANEDGANNRAQDPGSVLLE
jgi:hypothetical protein